MLTLVDFIVPSATLAIATSAQWFFGGDTSGFLGLGGALLARLWYTASSEPTTYSPLFVQMYTEGLISPQFTLALSQRGGYIALGAVSMSSSFADDERLHLNGTQTCTSVNSHTHGVARSAQLACQRNAHPQRYDERQSSHETLRGPRFDKNHTRTSVEMPSAWTAVPMPAYSVGPPIVSGFYAVEVQTLRLSTRGGATVSVPYSMPMIVDSGTSALILPARLAAAVNSLWNPRPDPLDGSLPCDVGAFRRIPRLGFTLANDTFWIDPQTLITRYEDGTCGAAVVGAEGDEPLILGTPFLMNVVAVFDVGDQVLRLKSTYPEQL